MSSGVEADDFDSQATLVGPEDVLPGASDDDKSKEKSLLGKLGDDLGSVGESFAIPLIKASPPTWKSFQQDNFVGPKTGNPYSGQPLHYDVPLDGFSSLRVEAYLNPFVEAGQTSERGLTLQKVQGFNANLQVFQELRLVEGCLQWAFCTSATDLEKSKQVLPAEIAARVSLGKNTRKASFNDKEADALGENFTKRCKLEKGKSSLDLTGGD